MVQNCSLVVPSEWLAMSGLVSQPCRSLFLEMSFYVPAKGAGALMDAEDRAHSVYAGQYHVDQRHLSLIQRDDEV